MHSREASNLEVIDSHLHVFRDERIGVLAQGGEKRVGYAGTLEEIRSLLSRGRIGGVFALASSAVELSRRLEKMGWPQELPAGERVRRERELEERLLARLVRENEWICTATREDARIQPVIFATATLDDQKMADEITDKVERFGVKAIKIHPALDFVAPTHPGYRPVFEIAQAQGVLVISHGGDSEGAPYQAPVDYCAPENFASVLRDFPRLRLVVAHLGYPYWDRLVEMASVHPNLHSDLSLVIQREGVENELLRQAIRGFGVERVLFGTDFPYFDPESCLDRLSSLGLSSVELEIITSQNARRVFELPESW